MSLSRPAYRGVNRIEKKHRVAVLRAADTVAKRLHWEKWKCERTFQGGYYEANVAGRGAVYVNMLDARSYGLGMLRICYDNAASRGQRPHLKQCLMTRISRRADRGGLPWREPKPSSVSPLIAPTQRMIDARAVKSKQTRDEIVAAFGGELPPRSASVAPVDVRLMRMAASAGNAVRRSSGNAPIVRMPMSTRGWMGVRHDRRGAMFRLRERALADRFFVVATRCKTLRPRRCTRPTAATDA